MKTSTSPSLSRARRSKASAAASQHGVEGLAFEKLHHEVGEPVLLAVVGHAHDVARLAREARSDLRLEEEPRRGGGVLLRDVPCHAAEELECDVLPQRAMVSHPHFAHRPAPEEAYELEFSTNDVADVDCRAHQTHMLAAAAEESRYIAIIMKDRASSTRVGSFHAPRAAEDPHSFAVAVGERVRHARQARGWTQVQLAEAAGLSPNYVARLERGELGPSFFVANQLCDSLQIDVNELLHGAVPPARTTRRRLIG